MKDKRRRFRVPAAGRILAAVCLAWALAVPNAPESQAFSMEKPGFSIQFGEQTTPHDVTGVFVLPGEDIPLEVIGPEPHSEFNLACGSGDTLRIDRYQWVWRAPRETGLHECVLTNGRTRAKMLLNMFVMVPFGMLRGEYLNGYRIGRYPSFSDNLQPNFGYPRGFIEVTKENEHAQLSPHFRLGQFVCRQQGGEGRPKYVVLRERLILGLERILEKVNELGIPCRTFTVMSGYRTPYFNRYLGNRRDSTHLWGAAADIFIDEGPKDGLMDDLNRDGRIDWKDAEVLYQIIDGMYGDSGHEPFVGGLAWYRATEWHGPFVHTDVRGYYARWGIP